MKLLSEATTLEEIITIASDKAFREHGAYLVNREVVNNRLLLSFACPTEEYEQAQIKKKLKKKIAKKDMLEYKDMFTLDHIKINLCNFIEPYKSDKAMQKSRKEVVNNMTKQNLDLV